jgi:hypothetical protein
MQRQFLIHTIGKVASQTLEAALRGATPDAVVMRTHQLSDPALARASTLAALPGIEGQGAVGVLAQLEQSRAIRAQWAAAADDSWVISGFRDPTSMVLAAYFQNLEIYCPWVTAEPSATADEARRLLEVLEEHFQRVLTQTPPRCYADDVLRRKLTRHDDWLREEMRDFHGLDVYAHPIGAQPFVPIRHAGRNYLIYRYEDFRRALPQIMQVVGLQSGPARSLNVAADKPIARLYAAVKEMFAESAVWRAYYYPERYMDHFYGRADARVAG